MSLYLFIFLFTWISLSFFLSYISSFSPSHLPVLISYLPLLTSILLPSVNRQIVDNYVCACAHRYYTDLQQSINAHKNNPIKVPTLTVTESYSSGILANPPPRIPPKNTNMIKVTEKSQAWFIQIKIPRATIFALGGKKKWHLPNLG